MNKFLLILFTFLLLPAVTSPQQRDSLFVAGTELWLGMSADQVLSALSSHASWNPKEGIITSREGPPYELYGTVELKNGSLVFVSKEWTLTQTPDTQIAFASALFGAVASVTGGKSTNCLVSTVHQRQPNNETEDTTIVCSTATANRSVYASHYKTQLAGVTGEIIGANVSERLEVPNRQSK